MSTCRSLSLVRYWSRFALSILLLRIFFLQSEWKGWQHSTKETNWMDFMMTIIRFRLLGWTFVVCYSNDWGYDNWDMMLLVYLNYVLYMFHCVVSVNVMWTEGDGRMLSFCFRFKGVKRKECGIVGFDLIYRNWIDLDPEIWKQSNSDIK